MGTKPSNHCLLHPFTTYSNYLLLSSDRNQLPLIINRPPIMDADHHHHYLSTEEVIRIAAARFLMIKSSSSSSSSSSHDHMLTSDDNDVVSLSEEATKMVDLVESLLAASDRVAHKDYDQAATHLAELKSSSSNVGNAIQRLVFYFSEALQERIHSQNDTGLSRSLSSSCSSSNNSSQIQRLASCLPMGVASQFAGVQAIVDEVTGAKRVHIIDLSIRNGVQWTILMSALASLHHEPPQLLKITAVGTNDDGSREMMEETGNRLASFAMTLKLPFSFHVVMVPELSDLKVNMLGLHIDDEDEDEEEEEAVAVYLDYVPRKLISSPSEFDKLMRVIKSVDPNVMVVSEVEANHNSPEFGHRFMESLFFFNAYFDAIDHLCVDHSRVAMEAMYCGESIRNIVACEGEERVVRNVPLRAWRMFFKRFGMVEVEMSASCFEQAKGVIESVGCEGLCRVEKDDEKSLVVGWNGTRLHSVSAWKFM